MWPWCFGTPSGIRVQSGPIQQDLHLWGLKTQLLHPHPAHHHLLPLSHLAFRLQRGFGVWPFHHQYPWRHLAILFHLPSYPKATVSGDAANICFKFGNGDDEQLHRKREWWLGGFLCQTVSVLGCFSLSFALVSPSDWQEVGKLGRQYI